MRNQLSTTFAAMVAALAFVAAPVAAQEYASNEPADDIVETAVAAGSFTTLATALEAAGLVETLKSEGPFTVFAPTDAAFEKLPEGTLQALLDNPEQLRAVLTYHVVAGEVTSDQVVNLESATTVQGQDIKIRVQNGQVMIDDATVTQADVQASNGVIHVIDSVILPEM